MEIKWWMWIIIVLISISFSPIIALLILGVTILDAYVKSHEERIKALERKLKKKK